MTGRQTREQAAAQPALRDRFGRPLRDLRISVTDRCNFRCTYCMPREIFGPNFEFLPRSEILSFEEITRVVRLFRKHGLQKIRLTGGEPTLRADLPRLIAMVRVSDQRGIPVFECLHDYFSPVHRRMSSIN